MSFVVLNHMADQDGNSRNGRQLAMQFALEDQMYSPVAQSAPRNLPAAYPLCRNESFGEFAPAGRYFPAFTLLTFATCMAVLAQELYENGRGVDVDAPRTDECWFKAEIYGMTFCAACLSTNPLFGPPTQVLLHMGARQGEPIIEKGETWRLVAAMYLHSGVGHCILNMVVLLQLGLELELAHGPLRVGVIYMLSGIFGNIVGTALSPYVISVGASGAIFGLVGACLGEIVQNWGLYASPCAALLNLSIAAVLQLLLGTMPQVDNLAHFFGFCMGILSSLSLLILPRQTSSGRLLATKWPHWLLQIIAATCVTAVFFVGVQVLYAGNSRQLCPWCDKISCLPFPWGCNPKQPGSCWGWDCSTCTSGGLSAQASWVGAKQNGTVVLRCPLLKHGAGHFDNVKVRPVNVAQLGQSALVGLCKAHCPDAYL